MKQQKESWVKILFSFASPCKGKMTLSVLCAILSVAGGFIPFWAVYEILLAFINQTVTLDGILFWCLGDWLSDTLCLLRHFYDFGTYFSLHDFAGHPAENRKPLDERSTWGSNGEADRLLEKYHHG